MSDSFAPVFKNTDGRLQRFGGEQTLTWDFTSAAGNPLELVVGGATYFTFDRTGALSLESDVLWNTDSGGDVGAQYDTRPDAVHAATTLAVGAVTGVGDGSQLILNRLILGHANVDKYVDAEQGLASTPFLRYNAVHSRWEFSNDGITVYSFASLIGATTWDDIYALDKALTIDSTTLTWSQTSTTGSGFIVQRALALANTDAPVMVVQQTSVADDQPALAIGQSTTAISALDIYEGTVAAGTLRFAFNAYGRLNIVSNAISTTEVLRLEQGAGTMPFLETVGTAAAGAGNSISTDAAPTADMLMVQVNAATRWIPAYASSVLPSFSSWDAIYALDKDLNISAAPLQFIQTSVTGYGFEVIRNLAAANTNAAILHVENQHSLDDQPSILIAGDAAVGVSKAVTSVVATSAGLTVGATVLTGVQSVINENVGDVATTELRAFYANTVPAAGAGTAIGYDASSTFDLGFRSAAPILCEVDVATATPMPPLVSPVGFVLADTSGAGDTIPFVIIDGPLTAPTTRVVVHRDGQFSIEAENTTQALEVTQSDVTTGNQILVKLTDGNLVDPRFELLQLGAITHTPYEVITDFSAYTVAVTSGGIGVLNILKGFVFDFTGVPADAGAIYGIDLLANLGGTSTARAVNIDADWTYGLYSGSPVLLDVSSATDSITIAQAGVGNLVDLITGTVGAGTSVWTMSSIGAVQHTTPNPTTPFTAYVIDLTSGGMDAEALIALSITMASNAGDLNNSPAYGIDLFHDGGGGSVNSRAVHITGQWEAGIEIDTTIGSGTGLSILSPIGTIIQTTGSVGNGWALYANGGLHHTGVAVAAGTPTHYLQSTSPTLASGESAYALRILSQTTAPGHALATHYALHIDNFGAGGSATLGTGVYVGTGFRYGLHSVSPLYINAPAAALAATVTAASNYQALDIDCTVTNVAGDISGVTVDMSHVVDLTQDGKLVYGIKSTAYSRLGDSSIGGPSVHAAYRAEFSGTQPTDLLDVRHYGLSCGAGFFAGVHSASSLMVECEPAVANTPVAYFGYTGAGAVSILDVGEGLITASTSRFSVANTGATIITCAATAGYSLTVKGNHADVELFNLYDDVNNLDRLTVALDGSTVITCAATAGYSLTVNGNHADVELLKLYDDVNNLDRFLVYLDGSVDTISTTTVGRELLLLDQNDEDQAFIDFAGAVPEATFAKNISTTPGDGAVTGPQTKVAADGWIFYGMVKVEVNGTAYWMPVYSADTYVP